MKTDPFYIILIIGLLAIINYLFHTNYNAVAIISLLLSTGILFFLWKIGPIKQNTKKLDANKTEKVDITRPRKVEITKNGKKLKKTNTVDSILSKEILIPVIILAIYTIVGIVMQFLGKTNIWILNILFLGFIFSILGKNISFTAKEKPFLLFVVLICLMFIFYARFVPVQREGLPIGYDSGIYMDAAEGYIYGFTDQWVYENSEPGFFMLTMPLIWAGMQTDSAIILIMLFSSVLLGYVLFEYIKRKSNLQIATLALAVYAFSNIQLKVYAFMYGKNVLALVFLLIAYYFIEKRQYVWGMFSVFVIALTHRPTLAAFGISYLLYFIINCIWKKDYKSKQFFAELALGIGALCFLFFVFSDRLIGIFAYLLPFLQAQTGSGTFLSFADYKTFLFAILPFAGFGFYVWLRKNIEEKQFDLVLTSFLSLLIIVFYRVVFFKRFIIHLDIFVIILVAIGMYSLIQISPKLLGKAMIGIVFVLLIGGALGESKAMGNNIHTEDIQLMKEFNKNFIDSSPNELPYIVSYTSKYATWLLGYTDAKIIAPGFLSYDTHNKKDWQDLWEGKNPEFFSEIKEEYGEFYLFIDKSKYNFECFSEISSNENSLILLYTC